MENGPFIDGLPMFTMVYLLKMVDLSRAMLNNQMVLQTDGTQGVQF
jgi:hypothetical protein